MTDLPRPLSAKAAVTSWRDQARCVGRPELFDPAESSQRAGHWDRAAAVCWGCPVATPCRDQARRAPDNDTYRGESPRQRRTYWRDVLGLECLSYANTLAPLSPSHVARRRPVDA